MVMQPERVRIVGMMKAQPGGGFLLTRQSPITGEDHTMDLPVTAQQLNRWANDWLIQDAMPQLTEDQREFIMTGMWGNDWDALKDPDD